MSNNAELGITVQKIICEKYDLNLHPNAVRQFEANYNPIYKQAASTVIRNIFAELKLAPVKCLTYSPSPKAGENLSPHNFILENGTTLSIRTNTTSGKVAPRVVGQAGIDTFNEHFSEISGIVVKDKEEIKAIVYEKIHLLLPIFIDYLFVSDYTVWIQSTNNQAFNYSIFDKSSFVDISLERSNFSFTRDLSTWNESTTLKYNGQSLAEIQIHKNRTFKFRFIMNALIKLLIEQKTTTETLGITAEKVVCELFGIPVPKEYRGRYSIPLSVEIRPTIKEAFYKLPRAIESTGAKKGARGGSSKCPYDFLLEGNKTLSLKTNTGKMICPPDVGQPGAETCYRYFKDFLNEPNVTAATFKKMVLEHIAEIMPIYVAHLFDSDFLLWIYKQGGKFKHKLYESNFAKNHIWEQAQFSFTKPSINEWNESNTVKYKGVSIGEFQVHTHRSSFKFRFNMENLEKVISQNNC